MHIRELPAAARERLTDWKARSYLRGGEHPIREALAGFVGYLCGGTAASAAYRLSGSWALAVPTWIAACSGSYLTVCGIARLAASPVFKRVARRAPRP